MDSRSQALGMIETWGVPALIAAADAAAKTADVRVTAYEKADAGIVTIYILGEVAAVKAAVEAGAVPTAGALYHWAAILKNKRWGWYTAWINLIGQIGIVAGIDYSVVVCRPASCKRIRLYV